MSNALTPVITNQGREALMNGFSTTSNYRFSHVALGDAHGAGYDVDPAITTLENELQRVTIESVVVQDSNRLHITAVAGLPQEGEEENAYDIHEIGFFLQPITSEGMETGEPLLFAVYATNPGDDQKALMTKEPGTELLLAFDLLLPDMSEEDYKFDGNSYLHIRSANKEMAGLVRLAKESDAVSGEADDVAVTPLGVKSAITNALTDRYADTRVTLEGKSSTQAVTPQGLKLTLDSKLASYDEALAGEADDKYISPLTLNNVLDEQAVKPGDMQAALINQLSNNDEALAGDIDDKAVTPAGLKAALQGFERTPSETTSKATDTTKDLTINGSINFGDTVRQMMNLWKTDYGIGIQSYTQYYRSYKNFAWFTKGVHHNDELNPGKGGTIQMALNNGNLGIGTANPAVPLHIIANKQYDGLQINHKTKKEYAAKLASDNGAGYLHINNKSGKARVSVLGDTGTVQLKNAQGKIGIDLKSNENEMFFADNGQIRSLDNNHRILFRRSENKMELREYGDIVLSPGAVKGAETAKVVITKDGNIGVGTQKPGAQLDIESLRVRPRSFKVEGDFKKFYPVIFIDLGWNDGMLELEICRPNIHTDSQWRGSLMSKFTAHSSNWGHGSDFIRAEVYQTKQRFIGNFANVFRATKLVVWLRGGGTTYFWRSNHPANVEDFSIKAKTLKFGKDTEKFAILSSVRKDINKDVYQT